MGKGRRTLDGRVLREEFLIRGWSIVDACEKTGLSDQTMYKVLESDKPLSSATETKIYRSLRDNPAPHGMRTLMKGADSNGYRAGDGP